MVLLILLSQFLGFGERVVILKNWISSIGVAGVLVFIVLYALSTLIGVPTSIMTVIAASLYGSIAGITIVSIALTLGAMLAFLLSRYVAQDAVHRWLKDHEKFKKVEDLTHTHGAIMVAITRLVPVIPFTILNYGFGLTRISFSTFAFWTWFSLLPGTILYVVGVDAVTKTLAEGKIPWLLVAIFAVMLTFIILLAKYIHRILKHKPPGS
ncbi:MAG: VTT domain-containing protein [bacterium]